MTTYLDVLAASREENFHSTENSYIGLHIKAYDVRERKTENLFFSLYLPPACPFQYIALNFIEQEKSKQASNIYFYSIITFPTSKQCR